ncbi:GMC family oxidoreductase [Aspergillus melleus]|uniref:GMC family oxidoreductase n=1 Tax=Aspergillus melleus TaxID=138277 RepID=UPI001E8D9163|nr:uncharacterized protein LDX57_009954 [Aspergillus melleus]KAH8432315.1 hypothetical protein LDX57_009954 [Aspergillus melleus]
MLFTWILLITSAIAAEYDYVIVGGGTSGLAVANRLSEDPNVSVLVIEAGDSVYDNPNVTDISRLAATYDSPLDWAFPTTEQTYGGRQQIMRAGKALGGTSVMNGAAYARAEPSQLDAFKRFGIDEWSWHSLYLYYLKSERFNAPNRTEVSAGATFAAQYHGFHGPVNVGFRPMSKGENDLTVAMNRTLGTIGLPWNPDLNSGHMRGFTLHPYTVDPDDIRSDAARAYYWPYKDRLNLHLKLDTFVTRLVWSDDDGHDKLRSEGIEVYESKHGKRYAINARREVILAAGAMRSPALLELSGVGNPRILEKNGIPLRINLPGVGENLQDQLNTSVVVSTKVPITGTRTVAFASAEDIFGSSTEYVAKSIRSKLPQYARATAQQSNGAMRQEDLVKLFEIQHDLIFSKQVPSAEFVFIPQGTHTLHTGYWGLLPFARGNVHISSPDPLSPPVVNPNYGMHDWDVQIQIGMSKFLRRMFQTGELKDIIGNETIPGLQVVPEDASDEDWKMWIGEQYTPNYHAIGTTSMLPREMGGVVDNRLKVYGTANVRVVDASIQPLQFCSHPMANLYGIAEWVSDMIKEEHRLNT